MTCIKRSAMYVDDYIMIKIQSYDINKAHGYDESSLRVIKMLYSYY